MTILNNQWGPWGSDDETKNPWNRSGRKKATKNQGFDDIFGVINEKLAGLGFGNGDGSGWDQLPKNKQTFIWGGLIILGLWLATGIYKVEPDEQGVVLRFGAWTRTVDPGLHYHLPTPIEQVEVIKVTVVNRIDCGVKDPMALSNRDTAREALHEGAPEKAREANEEAYMLTGDKNILEIAFSVLWQIKDAKDFLLNTRGPDKTVKVAAESAMREVIAQSTIGMAMTDGREEIREKVQTLLQNVVDEYKLGVHIIQVQLQDVSPPLPVVDAFRDVLSAGADKERLQNEALSYEKDILPKARGEGAEMVNRAEAYKQEVTARAEGDVARFLAVYNQYVTAKEVTMERMYREVVEKILKNRTKVIVDAQVGQGGQLLSYLPLPEIRKRAAQTSESTEQNEVKQ